MFYEKNLLTKRGKFGVIWIAATRPNGLKRRDYIAVNVPLQCRSLQEHIKISSLKKPRKQDYDETNNLVNDTIKFSLYLSAQLMFGIVKVFSQQHIYLFEDVNSTVSSVRYHRLSKSSGKTVVNIDVIEEINAEPLNLNDADVAFFQNFDAPLLTIPGPEIAVGSELTVSLDAHDINNPLNQPITADQHGGMDPGNLLELLGLDDPKNQQEGDADLIVHGSEQFRNAFAEVLDEMPNLRNETTVADEFGGPNPPNDENMVTYPISDVPEKPKRKHKVKDAVIIDTLMPSTQSNTPRLPDYKPEDYMHGFDFVFGRNFPVTGWPIDQNFTDTYFTCRFLLPSQHVRESSVIEGVDIDNFNGLADDPNVLSQNPEETTYAQSVEGVRASRATDKARSSSVLGHHYEPSITGSEKESRLNIGFDGFLEVPNPEHVANSDTLQNISVTSSFTDSHRLALRDWIDSSKPNGLEHFSTFAPPGTLIKKREAARVFMEMLFAAKRGEIDLTQEESYSEITLLKM